MIRIRLTDDTAKRRALGFLAGRYSFKSWATGEMLVPEYALPALAREGIAFIVEGPATYEQLISALCHYLSTAAVNRREQCLPRRESGGPT
jgi:hypothetical protein